MTKVCKKDSDFAICPHNPNKIKERFTLNHRSLLRTLRVRKIQKGVQKQAVYRTRCSVPGQIEEKHKTSHVNEWTRSGHKAECKRYWFMRNKSRSRVKWFYWQGDSLQIFFFLQVKLLPKVLKVIFKHISRKCT